MRTPYSIHSMTWKQTKCDTEKKRELNKKRGRDSRCRAWICSRVTNTAANKYLPAYFYIQYKMYDNILYVCLQTYNTIALDTSGDQLQILKLIVFVQNSTPRFISIVWVFFSSCRKKRNIRFDSHFLPALCRTSDQYHTIDCWADTKSNGVYSRK